MLANCLAYWEYLDAAITVYPLALKSKTDEQIKTILLHEFFHCILDEMKDYDETAKGQKHEERVCQMLTRAFLNKKV